MMIRLAARRPPFRLHGAHEAAQAGGIAGELEEPHQPEDAQEAQVPRHQEGEVERQDRQQVDDRVGRRRVFEARPRGVMPE